MKKKKPADEASTAIGEKVDAIIRLIDHCKRQNLAYFRGLDGVEFGFKREARRAPGIPGEEGDNWLP